MSYRKANRKEKRREEKGVKDLSSLLLYLLVSIQKMSWYNCSTAANMDGEIASGFVQAPYERKSGVRWNRVLPGNEMKRIKIATCTYYFYPLLFPRTKISNSEGRGIYLLTVR